jgi:hypothetical protein
MMCTRKAPRSDVGTPPGCCGEHGTHHRRADRCPVHDLRHTGNTLAARSGVSTRDLMSRMGHDSVRATIIYQHATTQADARIADSLDADIAGAIAGGGLEADGFGGGVVLPFG